MLQVKLGSTPTRRIARIGTVKAVTGLGRSTIYALMLKGEFPQPFRLVKGGKAVGWWLDEIEPYLAARAQASKGVTK